MDVLKIVVVALLGVCAVLVVRQIKPEFTSIVLIGCSVVIVGMVMQYAFDAVLSIYKLSQNAKVGSEAISCIIKVVGIGYLAEFCDDACKDSGCASIGTKVLFAAKVAILLCVFPVVESLFNVLRQLLL